MRKRPTFNAIFEFQGSRINYHVLGRGKPVLLVHGAFTNQGFDTFKGLLAKNHRVYILDLPGFGASDVVKNKVHNTDLFAEVLEAFIKTQGLTDTPIVALSLGAIVAIKTAIKAGTKSNLILVGMPTKVVGIMPIIMQKIPLSLKRALMSTQFALKKILLPTMRQNLGSSDGISNDSVLEILSATDPKAIADIDYKEEIEKDIPKVFKQLNNKVYFLFGEYDPTKPKASTVIKEYEIIPKSGHNPFFENPQTTLKYIEKYI